MKTYISGPIAGVEGLSREEKLARFDRAALVLTKQGHKPLNPLDVMACDTEECRPGEHETNERGEFRHSWDCYLRWDLLAMLEQCTQIALLPQWEESKGARLEVHVARELGWPVIDLSQNAVVLGLPHELQVGL